jgi:hypothetical protein
MTKATGSSQRKPKKWEDTKRGRDKNHALTAFRKWKKIEKARKTAETDRYNTLCGPVTITRITK